MAAKFWSAVAAIFLFVPWANAFVLDWDTVGWTGGTWASAGNPVTLTGTYTNVDGSGITMTVALTRTGTASGIAVTNTTTTPAVASSPIGHSYDSEQALYVDLNLQNRTTQTLRFTITFSQPVTNVSFQLWDLDLGNAPGSTYQDRVNNFIANGGVGGIAPTFTLLGSGTQDGNSAVDVAVVGTGTSAFLRGIATSGATNQAGNGNDQLNSGDVLVSYGTNTITSISFEYGSDDGNPPLATDFSTDTTLQRIALHDINFSSTVPEFGAALGALALCGWGWFGSSRSRSHAPR